VKDFGKGDFLFVQFGKNHYIVEVETNEEVGYYGVWYKGPKEKGKAFPRIEIKSLVLFKDVISQVRAPVNCHRNQRHFSPYFKDCESFFFPPT